MLTLEEISSRVQSLAKGVKESSESLNKMVESHISLVGQHNEALAFFDFAKQKKAAMANAPSVSNVKPIRKNTKKKESKEVVA